MFTNRSYNNITKKIILQKSNNSIIFDTTYLNISEKLLYNNNSFNNEIPIISYYIINYEVSNKIADIFLKYSIKKQTYKNIEQKLTDYYQLHIYFEVVDYMTDTNDIDEIKIDNVNFQYENNKIEHFSDIYVYITIPYKRRNQFDYWKNMFTSPFWGNKIPHFTIIITNSDNDVIDHDYGDNFKDQTNIVSIHQLYKIDDTQFEYKIIKQYIGTQILNEDTDTYKTRLDRIINIIFINNVFPTYNHNINVVFNTSFNTMSDISLQDILIVEHHSNNRSFSRVVWNLSFHTTVIFFNIHSLKYIEHFLAIKKEYSVYCCFKNDEFIFDNDTLVYYYNSNNNLRDIIFLVETEDKNMTETNSFINSILSTYAITMSSIEYCILHTTNITFYVNITIDNGTNNINLSYIDIENDNQYNFEGKYYIYIEYIKKINFKSNEYYIFHSYKPMLSGDSNVYDVTTQLEFIINKENLPLLDSGKSISSFKYKSSQDFRSRFFKATGESIIYKNMAVIDDRNNLYIPDNFTYININKKGYIVDKSISNILIKYIDNPSKMVEVENIVTSITMTQAKNAWFIIINTNDELLSNEKIMIYPLEDQHYNVYIEDEKFNNKYIYDVLDRNISTFKNIHINYDNIALFHFEKTN